MASDYGDEAGGKLLLDLRDADFTSASAGAIKYNLVGYDAAQFGDTDADFLGRFVDADEIGSIWTTYVRTTLSAEQAAALPEPAPSTLVQIKPPRSMADRVGRLFGRGKR